MGSTTDPRSPAALVATALVVGKRLPLLPLIFLVRPSVRARRNPCSCPILSNGDRVGPVSWPPRLCCQAAIRIRSLRLTPLTRRHGIACRRNCGIFGHGHGGIAAADLSNRPEQTGRRHRAAGKGDDWVRTRTGWEREARWFAATSYEPALHPAVVAAAPSAWRRCGPWWRSALRRGPRHRSKIR